MTRVGSQRHKKNIYIIYFNLIKPPSYMRSVVDRNVVMRRIPVYVCRTVCFFFSLFAYIFLCAHLPPRFNRLKCIFFLQSVRARFTPHNSGENCGFVYQFLRFQIRILRSMELRIKLFIALIVFTFEVECRRWGVVKMKMLWKHANLSCKHLKYKIDR